MQVRGAWKTAGVIGFRACRYAEALIAAADRTIISSSPIPSLFSSRAGFHGSRTVTAIDKSPCRSQTSLQRFLLLPSVSVNFVFFPLPPSLPFLPSFLPSLPFRNSATPELPPSPRVHRIIRTRILSNSSRLRYFSKIISHFTFHVEVFDLLCQGVSSSIRVQVARKLIFGGT